MKITAIKRQTKRDNRVSVFIDEEYKFSLSDIQLVDAGLRVGDEISQGEIDALKNESEIGKLKDLALKWAMRRDHSEREIWDYLKKKTSDEAVQKQVIDGLKTYDFIDDRRFAEGWLRSRRGSGKSRYVIRSELIKKGVSIEVLDELFENDDSELEALKILVDKKKHLAKYQDRQKFMAYLASKGYRYDDIKGVLEDEV